MTAIINFLFAAIKAGTPLLFGTTGEIVTQKAGNLNLGVEGMMYRGAFTGFYVGLDSIRKWYVAGTKSTGCLTSHPISTGLVELAGDGKTAKGLWYCIGQETVPGKAMWVTGKVAMDFVKEGDAWKIWHVVEANDLSGEAGENYAKGEPYWDPATDPIAQAFGTPDVAVNTHDPNFNWWDDYPSMPQPYETWSDDISYGPEGFKPPMNKGMNAKEGRNYK